MSLRPQTVPPETARIARAAFPKGNPYMQLRNEIGICLTMPILPTCFRLADSLPMLRGDLL